jgi:hypothetical protein
MDLSVNSTLKALLDDERARAILQKHLPGRGDDPRIGMVMYESLRSISYYPEAGISREVLEAIDEELRAL